MTCIVKMEQVMNSWIELEADTMEQALKTADMMHRLSPQLFKWVGKEAYAKDVERVDE